MTTGTSTILAAAFLLLTWQAQALECGQVPSDVAAAIDGVFKKDVEAARYLDGHWWWKCRGADKLRRLEREAKYPPAVLQKLDATENMAWQLYMGGKVTLDELDRAASRS